MKNKRWMILAGIASLSCIFGHQHKINAAATPIEDSLAKLQQSVRATKAGITQIAEQSRQVGDKLGQVKNLLEAMRNHLEGISSPANPHEKTLEDIKNLLNNAEVKAMIVKAHGMKPFDESLFPICTKINGISKTMDELVEKLKQNFSDYSDEQLALFKNECNEYCGTVIAWYKDLTKWGNYNIEILGGGGTNFEEGKVLGQNALTAYDTKEG